MEGGKRLPVIPPVVAVVEKGMTHIKAAHFILNKAAEQLPPLPQRAGGGR
jgi:hypothetical protein